MDKTFSIGRHIGLEALLGQVAEECCELGKAALKYQRILHGTNPTPVTEDAAKRALAEECTDVHLTLSVLACDFGLETYDENVAVDKMTRWAARIVAEGNEGFGADDADGGQT